LNAAGYYVGIEDEFDFTAPEKYAAYDVFGASVMTPQREASLQFLRFCKEHYPGKPVVIGGPHAKYYLEDVKKEPWDYVVPADGQRPAVEIMRGTAVGRVLWDMMSKWDWAYTHRPDRSSLESIDLLSKYKYFLDGRRCTTMLTALGCPERCTFCEEAQTAVRWRSISSIQNEIEDIQALGYGGVYIFDDLFAIALAKIEPICTLLHEHNLIYRCNGQSRYFNENFARLLAETGCREIAFGAETGSQKILDTIQKRTTVAMNYRFVELCKKYGIPCKAFLMIGLPGETRETIAETEKFIRDTQLSDFQLSIFYPYRGTQIRDQIDKGFLNAELTFEGEGLGAYGQRGGSTESVVRTPGLSSQELLSERDRLVHQYRPVSHVNKWETAPGTSHFFDTHLASEVEYGKE
jgi:radical SAM superfamily enzyme YgiQ (UPF0313 family)